MFLRVHITPCLPWHTHRYPPPPGIRERIYNFEGVAYANFDPKPFEGDAGWINSF